MIDNDHEGLMDGRAEQKMQLLTDEIESLWENLDGKFPEENASFEKSTMDTISKMHKLRLIREKHLTVPAENPVADIPIEQSKKPQFDVLMTKNEYWSCVVDGIKKEMEDTIESNPDGSKVDV